MKKIFALIISSIIIASIVASVFKLRTNHQDNDKENFAKEDIQETGILRIKKEGKLKVAVANNSIDYFTYKGRLMGLKYEIIKALCDSLGVKMELHVKNDFKGAFAGIQKDEFDIIAQDITVTNLRKELVDFTIPTNETNQVLVQRIPKNWDAISNTELDTIVIKNQLDLAMQTIVVPAFSAFASRLNHLSDEIGSPINIVEDTISTSEELIAKVSSGAIDRTVADRYIAEINQQYYKNIYIDLPISFVQTKAWVVKKGNQDLLDYIDNWLATFMKTGRYRELYAKYYNQRRLYISPENEFTNLAKGKFSKYDDLIKKKSKKYDIDWRLIAAIIYNESGFDADAESWVGAKGLMQIMPEAAKTFGIENFEEPASNLDVGLKLLKWLEDLLKDEIPSETERLKFVLASYNVGLGHVRDAQRLADKYGYISIVWKDNVAYFLQNKSNPKYYLDPIVKYGYCRGDEPFHYVDKVLDTYHHYCNLAKE